MVAPNTDKGFGSDRLRRLACGALFAMSFLDHFRFSVSSCDMAMTLVDISYLLKELCIL